MKYEREPIRKLIHRKAMAKYTNDMTKLSSWRIICYLIKRHNVELLSLAVGAEFALLIVT